MRPPQLTDTILRKIPVKSRPADLELIDHVTNERIVFRILPHRFGLTKIFRIHALWSSSSPSSFIGGGESGSGILLDQLALKLIRRCRHVKEQTSFRCGGVDIVREELTANAAIMDIRGGLDDLCEGTGDEGFQIMRVSPSLR